MTEQHKENQLEGQVEELQEMLNVSDILPPFEIAFEDYDLAEFSRGIKDTSYAAGTITALLNAGVSESFVLDFLLNKETINYNIKAAEINKEMNVEMSKNQRLIADKQEL